MPLQKILIRRERKEYIDDLGKELTVAKRRVYRVSNLEQDFNTAEGVIAKADLAKRDGSIVTTNRGKEFVIHSPSFIDSYKQLKRGAQIIPLKDLGVIITETGLGKNSTLVDAGAGSGALACFLAHYAKRVFTYDIREDFIEVVRKNIAYLGLKNITVAQHDIYESIPHRNVDVITLDLPEPWKVIPHLEKALTIGGFVVSYSPCVPQVADFVNAARKSEKLIFLKTIELIEREWDVDGRKVRPQTTGIGHSGFLSFCRRIS